ncbi:MAG TPA: cation:proton antiporter, partial [Polyangiaceae bacterium]|nr:cation:proton antiporter [Polyangiaceae bacterium]
MRRFLVIAILLAAMLGLDAFKAESGSTSPLTLAAVGFVVLASFTLAEFGGGFGLPRVTGYILAGIALGPSALDILSTREVADMRTFNALALGLIAVGAGLELDLKHLKQVFETLAGTIVLKVVLGVTLVGATFWVLHPYFDSIELADRDQVMTVALSVGVLSIGTSPAIALAVTSETRSKGRLTDLVLGAAVLKDLVVVICLAVAIAVGRDWLALEGEAGSVFWAITSELGSSLAAGAALGVVFILYIRFVKVEMLLFVAGIILVVSEVGRTLHLELLLVFITAGFVVRNFSKYEHALTPAVELVSLPVFVVFFTIAGAGLDLVTTWQILPLALILCAVRAAVYYTASRIGGALGGETVEVQRRAWLGYLPQAGVTLGLVGLTAAQLPTVAEVVLNLGFAVVAVNLLIGPITLKFALRSTGEIPRASQAPEPRVSESRAPPGTRPAAPKPEPAQLERVLESIEARELARIARDLARSLHEVVAEFEANHVEPWCKALEQAVHRAIRASRDESDWSLFAEWLQRVKNEDADAHVEQCLGLYYDLREQLRRLPDVSAVPISESELTVRAGDTWRVRLRIRLKRARRTLSFWRKPAPRRIPVQRLARAKMELRLASLVQTTLTAYYRTQTGALEDVRYWVQQHERAPASAEELETSITRRLHKLRESYRGDADTAIRAGLTALAGPLNQFDGPRLPASSVELGRAEPQLKATLDALGPNAESWARLSRSVAEELEAMVALAELRHEVQDSLLRTVIEPASTALNQVSAIVARVAGTLAEIRRELELDDRNERAGYQQAALTCRAALSEADH